MVKNAECSANISANIENGKSQKPPESSTDSGGDRTDESSERRRLIKAYPDHSRSSGYEHPMKNLSPQAVPPGRLGTVLMETCAQYTGSLRHEASASHSVGCSAALLEISSQRLLSLDRFEQCFEVSLPETPTPLALNNLIEQCRTIFDWLGEDL